MDTAWFIECQEQWRVADSRSLTDAFHYVDNTGDAADGMQWLRVSAYRIVVSAEVALWIKNAKQIGILLGINAQASPNEPAFQPIFFCEENQASGRNNVVNQIKMDWQHQVGGKTTGLGAPIPYVTQVQFRENWQTQPTFKLSDMFSFETTRAITNNPPGSQEPSAMFTRIRTHRYYFEQSDIASIQKTIDEMESIYFYPGIDLNKAAEGLIPFSPVFRFIPKADSAYKEEGGGGYEYLKPCPPTCP